MVMRHVDCDSFYVPESGVGMLAGKLEQRAASICTKLDIRLLDQVIYFVAPNLSPLMCRADYRKADGSVKARDELCPGVRVIRLGADAN